MKSQVVKRPKRIQVYFGEDVLEAYNDMQAVSKATRMSMSELAFISCVTGFYELKESFLKHQVPTVGVKSVKPRRRPATKTKKS